VSGRVSPIVPLATWMVNYHRQLPEKTIEFFGWNEMQTKTGIAVQRAKACCQGQYLFFAVKKCLSHL
ncbi:hypothetical protein, partial [Anaerovibrio slackiae]|uniref:hypothetical protein n=1 Tax=Anaerovibrio slackiae TaxID=2652309 RepID=UPI00386ACD5E